MNEIQVCRAFPFAFILSWDSPTPNYTVIYLNLILLPATHITSPVRQVQALSDFMNQMKVFFLLLFLPLFCSVNHSWNPKTLLMHRWNGCICGKDTAGFFLHGDRWEEITDKKYSAQFLNPDALSLMFLWGCHFTHISWSLLLVYIVFTNFIKKI